MDAPLAAFAETIRQAAAQQRALRLRGGGTKDIYGQALNGDVLDTRTYHGIVDYDPTELVLTARCGTPLVEIEAALARQGQMLAFEPPHFGTGATLGGCVAAGLSGPRRRAAGALRDFILGASLMNYRGDVLRFGGRVMKNVAGYDVSRALAGSLGTLGLIMDVSLKVLPKPAIDVTLTCELDEVRALRKLNEWAGQPLPISADAWHAETLTLRLSGTASAVEAAVTKLSNEFTWKRSDAAGAARFWENIRDHNDPFFGGDAPLWRLSLPSTTMALMPEDDQLIEWGGALRWLRTHTDAALLRATVERAGGHATLFRAADKSAGAFHPLSPALRKIHIALKTEFDPSGVFNPGRMYGDF
jgi:glycolate oxidase FAD binding subunit